jgi:hypothetical protein
MKLAVLFVTLSFFFVSALDVKEPAGQDQGPTSSAAVVGTLDEDPDRDDANAVVDQPITTDRQLGGGGYGYSRYTYNDYDNDDDEYYYHGGYTRGYSEYRSDGPHYEHSYHYVQSPRVVTRNYYYRGGSSGSRSGS